MTIGAKTSIKNVKLSLGVTVRDARINTSYVLPAAAINYILLKNHAELDDTNRNPFFPDSVVSVDNTYIGFGKHVSDFLDTSNDAISLGVTKGLSDTFSLTDIVNISVGHIRTISDSVTTTDTAATNFFKFIEDSVLMSDTLRFESGFSDTISSTDAGLLIMTDYADITYFAADYVGISLTF